MSGFVQWFRIAMDDGGGFHFVPAFWSEAALPAPAPAAGAGLGDTAAVEDRSEQPLRATPVGRPL